MTWEDIPGYFTWRGHSDAVADSAPPGSTIVEIGVLLGRSLAYLSSLPAVRDKGLRVVGVDHFLGCPEIDWAVEIDGRPLGEYPAGILAGHALAMLDAAGAAGRVHLIASDSVRAADLFYDGSVWSVFVDGGHSEEQCAADIVAWRRKVAPGGWLGGDDYSPEFPGVVAAVDRLVPNRNVDGRTWWVRVEA